MEMAGLTPASSSLTVEGDEKNLIGYVFVCVCVRVIWDLIGRYDGLTAALHAELFAAEDVVEEILQF